MLYKLLLIFAETSIFSFDAVNSLIIRSQLAPIKLSMEILILELFRSSSPEFIELNKFV